MRSKAQSIIKESNKVLGKLSDKQIEQYVKENFSEYQKEQFINFVKKGSNAISKINGQKAVESGQLAEAQKKTTEYHRNTNFQHQKNIAGMGGAVSANNPNHVNKKKAECPYCKKVGNYIAMKRWHFDNCKQK